MSNLPSLGSFLTALCQAYQQRQALLDVLGKPDDHLLRDAGMAREDALQIARRNLVIIAWISVRQYPTGQ